MSFSPERLATVRNNLNITKAEAARLMNTTPMGYWRYESGDRIPSYQVIQYMAETFGTSYEYLCGMTDDPSPSAVIIRKNQEPELYQLNASCLNNPEMKHRILKYYDEIKKKKQ